jgi:adenine-specific DNA methylase
VFIERDLPIEELNALALREGNSKRPIYQMHKWWARRLGSVFRMLTLATLAPEDTTRDQLWDHFYNSKSLKGKVILDPFMGGGTSVVEALRLGCSVIGMDINPVAWFITKKEMEAVDVTELKQAYERLRKRVADRILGYYATTCPGGHSAEFVYGLWVKSAPCFHCGAAVHLFPNYRVLRKADSVTVVCPNCWSVFKIQKGEPEASCPCCGLSFDPASGNSGKGRFSCRACLREETVLNAVRRLGGPLPLKLYAIEYFCRECGRGHKPADEKDLALYEQARREFESMRASLRFPCQQIPVEGRSDPRPVNHGYTHFWQMFNQRQLLCLGLLLEGIRSEPDRNLRELLLLAFSDCLESNNMFCKYEEDWQKISVLFGLHAYHPIERPAENNVWGGTYGRGTFTRCFRKVLRGKEFAYATFERALTNGRSARMHVPEQVDGRVAQAFSELNSGANALLICGDASEGVPVPRQSVDAVITDPPYLDNVMYAELSEFFYVWLREALKDDYPWFEAEHCEREREIVKNEKLGKSDTSFETGLTQVLERCHDALKDDGLLVFTFHHNKLSGWLTIARALVSARFYVSAAPVVRSEGKSGFHSSEGNIKYDAVLVCRKRDGLIWAAGWDQVREEAASRARMTVERLLQGGMALNRVDIGVVVMAKCLETWLRHHPHVLRDGESMGIDQLMTEAWRLAEELSVEAEAMYHSSGRAQRHLLEAPATYHG